MEIRINGKTADIKPDHEKTVGEVMASMEEWLVNSGHRLSGLTIDGEDLNISTLDEIFSRQIDAIKVLDIKTSSLAQLTALSFFNLLEDIKEFENLKTEEKGLFFNQWRERAQSLFISEQANDLFDYCVNLFLYGSMDAQTVYSITEERLREVKEPVAEFKIMEAIVHETCNRLIDLPLDIQTGKDAQAAQTIQIFSGVTEKIIRLVRQFDIQGLLSYQNSEEQSVITLLNGFVDYVKQLLDAYEKNDTVLVGDLAEYEVSPRLRDLYAALSPVQETK
jgi:hypothetical protein